jgi:hypothetical protein
MDRLAAVSLGIIAWLAVAGVAVSVVNVWGDDNQVLAFLPILAAVVVAWAIGEVVTARVFDNELDVSETDVTR